MRTKELSRNCDSNVGIGPTRGNIEHIEFECPCGKGKIIEEHDNIIGHREHDVWIECPDCYNKYDFDISHGVRHWELVDK